MPKKKGLGRDVNKSMEVMDSLLSCLRDFQRMPLKKGLQSNGLLEKDITTAINKAKETASSLANAVEDVEDMVKGVKPKGNPRFARNVVSKFLSATMEVES